MKYVKLFEQFVSEGIWAFNKESIPNFIKDLRKAKSSKDIKKLKDKYYNLVGDDTLFDYLDRAESGDGDFSNNVGDAIGRLEDLSDLKEAKYIKLSSVGSVIDQDGNVYPMLKGGKPDLDAGVHIDDIEKDEEWYSSLSDEDKRSISQFESYISEAIDIASLIGTLVNSMDSYDERDFVKFFKELGGSPKLAKTVFNDYWNVDAMDRMDWDTPDWKDWLFQRGIK